MESSDQLLKQKEKHLSEQSNNLFDVKSFLKQDKISSSDFNKIYKIKSKQTNETYIAKKFSQEIYQSPFYIISRYMQEVQTLLRSTHPSIVKYLGFSPNSFNEYSNKPIILTEFLLNGTLEQIINDNDKSLNDTDKLITIYGIANAISFLHSNNIIHRNIEPSHVLFDSNYHPKICGFGSSKTISSVSYCQLVGKPGYIAPEVYLNYNYSKASDVYSFAFLVYAIMTNKTDFYENSEDTQILKDVIEKVERPKFTEKVPKAYQSLIEQCWSQDPKQRPSFDEILNRLKNDREFITEKVNENKYRAYIDMLDKSPVSFDCNKRIKELDEIYEYNTSKTLNLLKKGTPFQIYSDGYSDEDDEYNDNDDDEYNDDENGKKKLNLDEKEIKDIIKKKMEKKDSSSWNVFESYKCKINDCPLICKRSVFQLNNLTQDEIIYACSEANIPLQIDHPCIIKNLKVSLKDHEDKPHLFIVQEYCSDVYSFAKFTETSSLIYIYGIAAGMAYLHSHKILHRDLKLENIYLDEFDCPKIGGFGLCKELSKEETAIKDDLKGTARYLSPETYNMNEYSYKSDVYSYGHLIYELLTNNTSFDKLASVKEIKEELLEYKTRPTFPKKINQAYRELIERCWSEEPKSRPTFDEILTLLKADPRFMTEMINKEDFLYYVNKIDEYSVSYDRNKRNQELDDIINNKLSEFPKIDINLNLGGIDDTEIVRIVTNDNHIQLNDFNNEKRFGTKTTYCITRVVNTETGDKYIKKVMDECFYDLYGYQYISFYQELNVLSQLNHPSILKLIGFDFNNDFKLTFITEYASNGTLDNFIYKKDKQNILNDTNKLIIMYGIAAGMAYLHSHKILHRDLKLENIYLDEFNCPKIGGFRVCKELSKEETTIKDDLKGTARYLSPETYKMNEYSYKSDVYSYGHLIYELLTNNTSFNKLASVKEIKEELLEHKTRPTFPKEINQAYRELIERCWSEEPKSRPTFDEILTLLKTDPKFITTKINKEEFIEYVKKIDESPISFDSTKKLTQLDEFLDLKFSNFRNENHKVNHKGIGHTERNKILFRDDQINLNKFDEQKLSLMIRYDTNEPTPNMFMYECSDNFNELVNAVFIQKDSDQSLIAKQLEMVCKLHPQLNHPLILKYIGYSPVNFKNNLNPAIVTEFPVNGNLTKLLEITKEDDDNEYDEEGELIIKEKKVSLPFWTDTKKLIILYGIARIMSYLYSHGIVYRFLRPDTIFLDQYLFPKIGNFTWANEKNGQKTQNPPIDFKYSDDQTYRKRILNEKTDVYSYATIAYKILSNKEPSTLQGGFLYNNRRPQLDENAYPRCYQKLINNCWSKDIKERFTFDRILHELKTNPDFITEKVNKEMFFEYIKCVDSDQEYANLPVFKNEIVDLKQYSKRFSVNMETIDLSKYQKEKKIGKGGFGSVYAVTEKETGDTYAAKVAIFDMDGCSADTITNLEREIEIISNINHPSVLKYIGYNSHDFKERFRPTIITEYASNGSLDRIIELEAMSCAPDGWSDTKKLIILKGVADGMVHLQEKGIIHRDLKPANIFLDENFYPKIGDFGLSKENSQADENLIRQSGFKGTYAYCAPETLSSSEYSEKTDVYSFGMIMYELMTCVTPYKGMNIFQVLQETLKGFVPKYPFPIPECYRKLIDECLSKDPNNRPTFQWINTQLNSEFVTSAIDGKEFDEYNDMLNENQFRNIYFNSHGVLPPKFRRTYVSKDDSKKTNQSTKNNDISYNNENFIDLSKFKKVSLLIKKDIFKIYLVQEKSTGKIYSAKISMFEIKDCSHDDIIKLSREVNLLSKVNHPSFVKFIGYSPTDFKGRLYPVIITELTSNGSIDAVQQNDDTNKLICIYGIASGMSFLHKNEIFFRDLKPSNIFLDMKMHPKIGDFGLSTMLNSVDNFTFQTMSGMKGLPIYSAPEVLQCGDYSFKSDVYSFAMITFQIVTGVMPFKGMGGNQVLEEIVMKENRPEIRKNVPEAYKNLIEKCWSHDPSERPTFEQIMTELKTNTEFITDNVNQDAFSNYVEYIDHCVTTFEKSKKIVQFDDFIKSKSKIVEDKS